jgi:hypothetical protein
MVLEAADDTLATVALRAAHIYGPGVALHWVKEMHTAMPCLVPHNPCIFYIPSRQVTL